jgi:hypothetical protein
VVGTETKDHPVGTGFNHGHRAVGLYKYRYLP